MKKFALLMFALVIAAGVAVQSQNAPADFPVEEQELLDAAESAPVDPNAVAAPAAPANPLPPEMSDPLLEGFFEDIGYTSMDKRDPFLPYMSPSQRLTNAPDVPLEPLQRFALNQLKLVGIIWDVGTPKALIEDPAGKSHIIIENTKLGQQMGYVAAIREGEIIVVEPLINPEGKKSFQTKILKLSALITGGAK